MPVTEAKTEGVGLSPPPAQLRLRGRDVVSFQLEITLGVLVPTRATFATLVSKGALLLSERAEPRVLSLST